MNIKTRLSVQFSLFVVLILLFFSVLVYYFSFNLQRNRFREQLLEKATNSAILLINVEEVDSTLLQKIHRSTVNLPDEEIILTDSAYNIIYSFGRLLLKEDRLSGISANQAYSYFSLGLKDGISYRHENSGKHFYVFVAATDIERYTSLKDLRETLLWSIFISLWLSVYISYIFSRNAINPISGIIRSIKTITASKLYSRLDPGKGKDEIEQLAITFNNMIESLENAFKSQEEFVSNAAHELRTPISIMKSEADYFVSRKRDPAEDEKYIKRLSDDLSHLNSLANSLLELAQINRGTLPGMTRVRIDDVLYNSIRLIKLKYPDRKIIPHFGYTDMEEDLFVSGNPGLLEIALRNILDNACKFSENDITVEMTIDTGKIDIAVSDTGIGIPEGEIEELHNPFRRGSNSKYIAGYGLGLSLVKKIAELHGAQLRLISRENSGTRVEISFSRSG